MDTLLHSELKLWGMTCPRCKHYNAMLYDGDKTFTESAKWNVNPPELKEVYTCRDCSYSAVIIMNVQPGTKFTFLQDLIDESDFSN